jgi:hypothetical protein
MEAGKANPREKFPQGRAVDFAGTQVGVSGKTVGAARKIAEASEETYQELLSGKLTLAQAAKEIKAADAPVLQPEPKRLSASEAIARIIKLIPEELANDLLSIAEEAPASVRNAIRACFSPDEHAAENAEAENTGSK